MYHHDNRDYDVAVKEAQVRLDETIHKNIASAARVVERIMTDVPNDRVVSTHALRVAYTTDVQPGKDDRGRDIEVPHHRLLLATRSGKIAGAFDEGLHNNAINQLADKTGVPTTFVNRMLNRPYGGELLTETFNTILAKEEEDRYLLRSVNDEVRGVLASNYRRLDSRPLIETFAEAVRSVGAEMIMGLGGDLRFALKAVMPKVYMVGPKGKEEALTFGVEFSNSDFGKGALSLSFFVLRAWCTNFATSESIIRQVHLGKRLGDDIEYSDRTYRLDTEATRAQLQDVVVKGALGPARIDASIRTIEAAMEENIEPKKFFERDGVLAKLSLSKGEIEKARDTYNNGGVEQLPPGNNLFRMSNALSWIAQSAENAERRLELERAAGQVLERAKAAA